MKRSRPLPLPPLRALPRWAQAFTAKRKATPRLTPNLAPPIFRLPHAGLTTSSPYSRWAAWRARRAVGWRRCPILLRSNA